MLCALYVGATGEEGFALSVLLLLLLLRRPVFFVGWGGGAVREGKQGEKKKVDECKQEE